MLKYVIINVLFHKLKKLSMEKVSVENLSIENLSTKFKL